MAVFMAGTLKQAARKWKQVAFSAPPADAKSYAPAHDGRAVGRYGQSHAII
jgi:hypothetical protein